MRRPLGRVCVIVNPFAGAGGPLGWKGTDWPLPLKLRGTDPEDLPAYGRSLRFFMKLKQTASRRGVRLQLRVPPHPMGGGAAERAGIDFEVLKCIERGKWPTTPDDTARCARACVGWADLVVFVGGDGTARLIADVLDKQIPILGVPAGVKVYSAVFAENPEAAAEVVIDYITGTARPEEREILDIDEEAFRRRRLNVKLAATALTPVVPARIVSGKQVFHPPSEIEEMREIAYYIRDEIASPCTLLILGPGRTVYEIARVLGVEKSLLGVDAYHNGKLVGRDLNEQDLLGLLEKRKWSRVFIIVTPIGGQGFILGRGNQQISPRVLRRVGKDGVLIVATPTKLSRLKWLRVDTGDPEVDSWFKGYVKVLIGYNRFRMVETR